MNSRTRLIFMEVTKNTRVKVQEVMLTRETTHVPARKTREMARKIQRTIWKIPHCPVSKTAQQIPTRALNFQNSKTRRKRVMALSEATLASALNAHQKPRATPKRPSIPPTSQQLINSI